MHYHSRIDISKLRTQALKCVEKIKPRLVIGQYWTDGVLNIIDKDYSLKITISESEISFYFQLAYQVNGFTMGIESVADYSPYIGDPELEKVALNIYAEVLDFIETINKKEIYIGTLDKSAYIAWQSKNYYALKKYKKILFGVRCEEKYIKKGDLNMYTPRVALE